MPESPPERIWAQIEMDGTWSNIKLHGDDTEYVRADLCAELEVFPPRSGHWTGVEMEQARYLIAAMTGRTPAEVTEPLSELCHSLRYRGKFPALNRETVASMMGEIYIEGLRMQGYKGPITGWNDTWFPEDRAWIYEWIDGALHPESPPGMVVTDLDAWEGEDGG